MGGALVFDGVAFTGGALAFNGGTFAFASELGSVFRTNEGTLLSLAFTSFPLPIAFCGGFNLAHFASFLLLAFGVVGSGSHFGVGGGHAGGVASVIFVFFAGGLGL